MLPAERDALEHECPYKRICVLYEDCPPDEFIWGECWTYRTFLGILRDDVEIMEYKSKTIREIIEVNNEN